VRLTEAGTVLADYARRIFGPGGRGGRGDERSERTPPRVAGHRRGHDRRRVSAAAAALVEFRRRFPGIKLRMEIGVAALMRRRLEENALDLVLTEGVVESPDLESTLFAER